jgi:prepilin peptidase CpaA
MSIDPSTALSIAVSGLLLIAAATDVTQLRIPNWISVAILVLFLVFAAISGLPPNEVLSHVFAAFAVLAGGIILFSWGKLGGGDVKILSAVSLCVGWEGLFRFVLAVSLLGAVVTLAVIVLRTRFLAATIQSTGYRPAMLDTGAGAPYAIAIASGFILLQLAPLQ